MTGRDREHPTGPPIPEDAHAPKPWAVDPAGLEGQREEHALSEAMRSVEERVREARRRIAAHESAVRGLASTPPSRD